MRENPEVITRELTLIASAIKHTKETTWDILAVRNMTEYYQEIKLKLKK